MEDVTSFKTCAHVLKFGKYSKHKVKKKYQL